MTDRPPSAHPQPYTAWLLGLLAALMAGAAAGNYLVDPFGIFAAPVWPGHTAHKPGLHNRDRMVKAYAIARRQPDALLLGTSRVQFGMDPDAAALARHSARPYNAGLVNADLYMVLRYLQHAQAVHPLRLALIGLDPLMFDGHAAAARRDFTEQRLAAAADGRPQAPLTRGDLPLTLLSGTAVQLSYETLAHQADIRTDLLDNGQRDPQVLAGYSRANGSLAANIALIERDYVRELAAAQLLDADGQPENVAVLRQILDFARAHQVALHLFFTPGHVRMLELMRATGRLDDADRIKRAVVAQVAAEASASGGRPAAVWDFSLPNAVTTEAVPGAAAAAAAADELRGAAALDEARATMAGYWETSHFRAAVGDRMLARMLDTSEESVVSGQTAARVEKSAATSDVFGVALSTFNIDATLADERRDLAAWERQHGAEVAQIAGYAAAEAARLAGLAAARRAHGAGR